MRVTTLFLCCLLTRWAWGEATPCPTGHDVPEGPACDAVVAFLQGNSTQWKDAIVKPIFGNQDGAYSTFMGNMVAEIDARKASGKVGGRILKCYKARHLSKDGPASMAYA